MLVSILHRVTGSGMATVGTLLFVWWLAALAGGESSYAYFLSWFTGDWAPLGYLFGIGLTWSVFQHMATGVRHLFMDVGALFELGVNKRAAQITILFSIVATIAYWAYLIGGKSHG